MCPGISRSITEQTFHLSIATWNADTLAVVDHKVAQHTQIVLSPILSLQVTALCKNLRYKSR
jgi:hypothetical protein